MMESKAKSSDKVSGAIERFSGFGEGAAGGGTFIFEAYDKDGNLKWTAEAKNLTTNVGRQDMNAKYFLGSGYTAFGTLAWLTTPQHLLTMLLTPWRLTLVGTKPPLMILQTVLRLLLVRQLTTIPRLFLTRLPRVARLQASQLTVR
jgi:hypothetical protein